ncbi:protein kinase family protein [Microbispora sp. H10885]|uniref:protein kinase family protein n=1 Tax=Microbispora sp. H10885 TaxID=2729110 RepID=UPI0016043332|nr:protein kinase family protein [Microbispora sp. H10885]
MHATSPLRPDDRERLGGYRLLGRIIETASAVVYAGESDTGEGVTVTLYDLALAEPDSFLLGAEALRRLTAKGHVPLLDAGVARDRPYVVTRHVEGPTLTEEVTGRGPLAGPALHRLAVETVTALASAHQAGIVHGHLGPDAVILAAGGPQLAGTGIGPLLDSTAGPSLSASTRPLRPDELTPERLAGEETGPPADLFAWASAIVFAATGRHPYQAGSPAGAVNRVLRGEPDLSALDEPLRGLLAGCLAKDPATRPTAADTVLALVGHTVGHTLTGPLSPAAEAAAGPEAPPSGDKRSGGWRPALVLAGLAIALVSAGAGHALALRKTAAPVPVAISPPALEIVSAAPDPPTPPAATTRLPVPGVRMTLHESPQDATRMAAYRVGRNTYLRTADAFGRLETPDVEALPSSGGSWLALFTAAPENAKAGSEGGSVEFRDQRGGLRFTLRPAAPGGRLYRPTWSPDGTRLLLSVVAGEDTPTGFVVLDPAKRTSSYVDTPDENEQGEGAYAWLPDGSGVAVGYVTERRHGVRFRDLAGRRTRDLPWVGRSVGRRMFSPSGRVFVTYCPSGGTLCLWDTAGGGRRVSIGIFFAGYALLGWYDDAHLIVLDPSGDSHRIVVMDGRGREQRVLAEIAAADDTDDLLFTYIPPAPGTRS